MKRRCYNCGKDWLNTHENWPAVKILIDPETGMPHKCNPKEQRVPEGKWKGFTFAQMASLWYAKKMGDMYPRSETQGNLTEE